MASNEPPAATVIDPDGREAVLLARIWHDKIARDHPELVDHLEAVIETVTKPDHIEADALPNHTRKGSQAVEAVNIRIGPLTFDHADYDADGDVLYLHIGQPQPGEGGETPEGHVLRFAPGTQHTLA